MSVPVAFLPAAEDDIASAYDYYEHKLPGLGAKFVAAIRARIDQIADNPALYGTYRRDVRAAPTDRFPYVVYYRDRGADVLVIAVQHGRRSTRGWRGRV